MLEEKDQRVLEIVEREILALAIVALVVVVLALEAKVTEEVCCPFSSYPSNYRLVVAAMDLTWVCFEA